MINMVHLSDIFHIESTLNIYFNINKMESHNYYNYVIINPEVIKSIFIQKIPKYKKFIETSYNNLHYHEKHHIINCILKIVQTNYYNYFIMEELLNFISEVIEFEKDFKITLGILLKN
jgi:hypothetical protein